MKIKIFHENNKHLYAFLIASVIATISFFFAGILPGQAWTDISDSYTASAAFSRMLTRHITEGFGLFYSHELSLGQNTSMSYAMYGYSPFTLLYILPIDTYSVMIITHILRIGFASAFFELFLRKHMNIKGLCTIFFSLCYSLSAFHIFFLLSANFSEGVYLFPLLMISLFKYIKTKKCSPLCICYILCFVSNFYSGYIIGLASFSALMLNLILQDGKLFIKKNLYLLIRYAILVLTALAVSMLVLLPAFTFYSKVMAGAFNAKFLSTAPPITLLSGCYWGDHNNIMDDYTSLYAATPVLMLCILYFFNKSFKRSERLLMLVALLSFIPAYYCDSLNLALHAFNPPTGFPMRFAYVYVFLIVLIAARQYSRIRVSLIHERSGQLIILLIYCIIACFSLIIGRNATYVTVLINILLIALWAIFLSVLKPVLSSTLFSCLGLFLLTVELSTGIAVGYINDIPAPQYRLYADQLPDIIARIQKDQTDGQLYRARISNSLSPNLPAEYGYNGTSFFSTSVYPALQVFMLRIGDNITGYTYACEGLTDFTEMLLGIRYQARLNSLHNVFDNDISYYNINKHALPIGFAASKDIINLPALDINPFENQNNILSALLGTRKNAYIASPTPEPAYQDMYLKLENDGSLLMQRTSDSTPGMASLSIPKKEYSSAYLMLSNVKDNKTPSERRQTPDEALLSLFSEKDQFSDGVRGPECLNPTKGIIEMDVEDDLFYVLLMDEQFPETITRINHIYTYYQDDELLDSAFEKLSSNGWIINSSDSLHIDATIDIPEDRPILFISIPYDMGWSCSVDGQDKEIQKVIDDTFMAIPLSPGSHNVKLTYTVPGLKTGLLLFALGMISFIILIITDYKRVIQTRLLKNKSLNI